MSKTRPYINREAVRHDLDTLEFVPTVTVPGRSIKAGMVLVDPVLNTPLAEVDHLMRSERNSGNVTVLAFDYETRRWTEESFHANAMIKVMAEA